MTSKFARSRMLLLLSVTLPLAAAACSSATNGRDTGSESAVGTLSLPLSTPTGSVFRLVHAVFEVTDDHGRNVLVETDASADAERLEVALSQGTYRVTLRDGWSLEKMGADSVFTQVPAALLTQNPSSVTIIDHERTKLVYSFHVGETLVTFGEGELGVQIDVPDAPPLSGCDVLSQTGCPSGQSCLLFDASGATYCAASGSARSGEACQGQECLLGSQCLKVDSEDEAPATCTRFCNASVAEFGCDCQSLSFSPIVGVCQSNTAGACELLSQQGCSPGEACQYRGGDAGTCGVPGGAPIAQACFEGDCAAGFECVGDDVGTGLAGACWPYCDLTAPSCPVFFDPWFGWRGTTCRDIGHGNVGACMR
jgi:hypothetical protein